MCPISVSIRSDTSDVLELVSVLRWQSPERATGASQILGVPAEMVSYTLNGCAPEFALWDFVDLGYLTYYTSYLIATGQMVGEIGETFEAGRMGTYTIEKDPTRDAGARVLMGPFTVYTEENVEAAAQ